MRQFTARTGSRATVLVCHQAGCDFQVDIRKTTRRADRGLWFITHAVPHNELVCCPVAKTCISPAMVASLPCMQSVITSSSCNIPQRIQQELIFREHGIRVNPVTVCRAACIVREMAMDTAASKLMGLGKLLQSFMHKNPGSAIKVERDAEDALQSFFIRPGAHSCAIPALLSIAHNDAFHVKTVIFNSNMVGTAFLTNQRTTFIYSIGLFPVENEANWTWYMDSLNKGPMGDWLQSGKVLMMGDREKGEEAAAISIFPDAPKAACLYHIRKNMGGGSSYFNIS